MDNIRTTYHTVDEYITRFPVFTQMKLVQIRRIIKETAPDAQEKISYSIPTFYLKGNLVHFAGYKGHIGFYPTSSGIRAFASELAGYKTSKGSVQFPLDDRLPVDLIKRIVHYRVKENLNNAKK